MVAFKLLLAAASAGLVTAWPEPSAAARLDQRAINCAKITGALSVLKKLGPPATSFCSSYLKIQGAKTVTTTFTPAQVTSTTSTTTVTTRPSVCPQQKRNGPIDPRSFQNEERGDILPLLAAFAAAKVSEGCSCLSLQPKTSTTTSTAAAPTTNVVATQTQCVACKGSDLNSACSAANECCSGRCENVLNTPSCCNAGGVPCDLLNPGACCSGTCVSNGSGGANCL